MYTLTQLNTELRSALGDGVVVEVFRACEEAISDAEGKKHSNCAVMKVNVGRHGFLFTGDASGAALTGILRSEPNVVQGVSAMILSHHGSDAENALEWYHQVMINASDPVLCLVSSDPRGSSGIPSFLTVRSLLQDYSVVEDLLTLYQSGEAYCAYHQVEGFEERCGAVIEVPACNSAGLLLPIFITSKAKENRGDGVYRIIMDAAENVFMRNSHIDNGYQFARTPNHASAVHINNNIIQYRFGKVACAEVMAQLDQAISGVRQNPELQQFAQLSSNADMSSAEYTEQFGLLDISIEKQIRCVRYWGLRHEVIKSFLSVDEASLFAGGISLMEQLKSLIGALLEMRGFTEELERYGFGGCGTAQFKNMTAEEVRYNELRENIKSCSISTDTVDEIRAIMGGEDSEAEAYLREIGIIR